MDLGTIAERVSSGTYYAFDFDAFVKVNLFAFKFSFSLSLYFIGCWHGVVKLLRLQHGE
jgi:hypothetical protein